MSLYDYNYDYNFDPNFPSMFASLSAIIFTFWIVFIIIFAISIIPKWKLFEKAGQPGWAAIVPFYNKYVLFDITWGNGILFLLTFIPGANAVIMIITWVKLAQAFGKDAGWACGLIFLNIIFLFIMAFSDDIVYVGVPGNQAKNGTGYGQPGYQQRPGYQNPYYQGNQQQYSQQSGYQQTSAPVDTKYCTACGIPMEKSVKFCPHCGKEQ